MPVIVGYARVSTDGQSVADQVAALKAAGAVKVYSEKQSGAESDRPQLAKAIATATFVGRKSLVQRQPDPWTRSHRLGHETWERSMTLAPRPAAGLQ
jgi:DNA invertase Pin-like site-specific DNA recombinase